MTERMISAKNKLVSIKLYYQKRKIFTEDLKNLIEDTSKKFESGTIDKENMDTLKDFFEKTLFMYMDIHKKNLKKLSELNNRAKELGVTEESFIVLEYELDDKQVDILTSSIHPTFGMFDTMRNYEMLILYEQKILSNSTTRIDAKEEYKKLDLIREKQYKLTLMLALTSIVIGCIGILLGF